MSHLNTAYSLGMKKAAEDFAQHMQNLEKQATGLTPQGAGIQAQQQAQRTPLTLKQPEINNLSKAIPAPSLNTGKSPFNANASRLPAKRDAGIQQL